MPPSGNIAAIKNIFQKKITRGNRVLKRVSLLILFTAMILIFSCRKESDCFECTTTFRTTLIYEGQSEVSSVSDTQEFCNKTEEEMRAYETRNTNTTTFETSGITNIIVKTTICVK